MNMNPKRLLAAAALCAATAAALLFYTGDGPLFARSYMALNGRPVAGHPEECHLAVTIPYNTGIRVVSPHEVVELLGSGRDAFVLFGYPECPWCRHYAPLVATALRQTGVRNFYYCNIAAYSNLYGLAPDGTLHKTRQEKPGYYELLAQPTLLPWLEDYTLQAGDTEYPVGEKRIYVPTLFAVVGGQVVAKTSYGITPEPGQSKYAEWTAEQNAECLQHLIRFLTSPQG